VDKGPELKRGGGTRVTENKKKNNYFSYNIKYNKLGMIIVKLV